MTYAPQPPPASRMLAVVLSTAIHAAIGLAFLATLNAGASDAGRRRGARGEATVLTLLPLPPGGHSENAGEIRQRSHGTGQGQSDTARLRAGPTQKGQGAQMGSPPPGDGSPQQSAALAKTGTTSTGAPSMPGTEIEAFRARLLHHIEQFRRYPPAARQAALAGVVRIHFVMDQAGDVTEAWVEISSGSTLLDEEAVAAVMRARPLPSPPSDWPQSFGVTLPIDFVLQ